MRLLFILLPLCAFGANLFTEPDPSEVLVVYNSNSTLDTDGNGVADHVQILEKLTEIRGTVPNTLAIATGIDYISESQAYAIHIDQLHYDLDTSQTYGDDASVSIGSRDYILQKIAQWFDADSVNRWGRVKYIELVMGMPYKVRGNDNLGRLPENSGDIGLSNGDSTLYRSLACYIWTFLAPGAESNGYFSGKRVSRLRTNPYYSQVKLNGSFDFVPGLLKSGLQNGIVGDSLAMWVAIPTYLDGNNVADVIAMLDRSQYEPVLASGAAKNDYWAVFDESNTGDSRRPYQAIAALDDTLDKIFTGGRTLADIDSVPAAAGTDTVFVGWSGDVTLQSGDSCALYFTAASKHDPRPSTSNRWYYEIGFPIAPGALTWASESFNAYTPRDTSLRPPGEGTQTLLCEAIENGFTYGLGECYEPVSSGLPHPQMIANGMRIPNLPFALLASAALGGDPNGTGNKGTLYSHIAVGPAIGYFRPSLAASSETATFAGACSEQIIYSSTMPATADSVIFYRITEDAETLITRVNTSGGGAVNQTLGSLWSSKPLAKVLVTILDSEGVPSTTEFISQ